MRRKHYLIPWAAERLQNPRVSRMLRKLNDGGESQYLEGVRAGSIPSPVGLERLAKEAELRGSEAEAAVLRRRALELDPTSGERKLAYAKSLTVPLVPGTVRAGSLGLRQGATPLDGKAIPLLRSVVEQEPNNREAHYELYGALYRSGEADLALEHLEKALANEPPVSWLLEAALAYRRPQVARFDRALGFYEEVLDREPANQRALNGLIICGLRQGVSFDRLWQRLRRVEIATRDSDVDSALVTGCDLLFTSESTGEDFTSIISEQFVSDALREGTLHETIDLIVARVQFAGELALGYRIRKQLAEYVSSTALSSYSMGNIQQFVTSKIYRGRANEARDFISSAPLIARVGEKDKDKLTKLTTDVYLAAGDSAPLIQYARHLSAEQPVHGEGRMAQLVRGRRIAVVGPSSTAERFGREIDGFDVVVRPNFQPDVVAENSHLFGSRTDITYYSGQDLQRALDEVAPFAEQGEVSMVVGRPLSVASVGAHQPEWFRLMRHECSLYFRGTPQGISRIVYDLLQFAPEEIVLYNVDFYSGANAYAAGYRAPTVHGPGSSFLNDMLVVHDLRYEFELLQSFQRTGIFRGKGVAEQVMRLTPDNYVGLLETQSVLSKGRTEVSA